MRPFTIKTMILLTCTLFATSLWAVSPTYHFANSSLDPSTACYNVNFFESGLGGAGFTSDNYTITCTAINYSVGCLNHGGNKVQGTPKSGTTSGSASTPVPITNGNTRDTVSLCPANVTLPNPGCTGSQQEVILAASYSGCKLSESDFGSTITTGDQSNPNLFVIVK